jgi:hypothetical protein
LQACALRNDLLVCQLFSLFPPCGNRRLWTNQDVSYVEDA